MSSPLHAVAAADPDFTEEDPHHHHETNCDNDGYDGWAVFAWIVIAILVLLYLILVVYLAFAMFTLNQIALFIIVLIGSFLVPVIIPAVFLILLATDSIPENIDTRVVVKAGE